VLALSRLIDRVNEAVGRSVAWLVLAAVLVSAGNAVVRKLFNTSSNAFLEFQWYLFSAVFLLAAAQTLLRQEHVRIDLISARLSARSRAWIDVFGIVCFLFPLVAVVIDLSWPLLVRAYLSGEMSSNAGGLIRWPVLALLPFGFGLLGAQGISELIKRVAFLRGVLPVSSISAPPDKPGPA
jgi:TRAP-type mannitol/chloroaromatic compound transport system permease small subunit